MTNAALARPVAAVNAAALKARQARPLGQIVMAPDQWHNGALRPHIVVGRRGTTYHVVPVSHTPQGRFHTNELGGATYFAGFNKFTGTWNGFFVEGCLVSTYQRQLKADTQLALAEINRQHKERN